MSAPSLRDMTLSMLLIFAGGYALSLVYPWIGSLAQPSWLPIALLHSLIAFILMQRLPQVPRKMGAWAYAPGIIILFGALLISLASRWLGPYAPPSSFRFDSTQVAWILWIPIVEECVFRMGIGRFLRGRIGPLWGAYASAILFAIAHSEGPTLIPAIPLGPLLLGLLCEAIDLRTGRITAAMAAHAACNASAWIFASIDPRWLDWLKDFYVRA